jgi:hypothetical protein
VIVVIEAVPVSQHLRAASRGVAAEEGYTGLFLALGIVILVCGAATVVPLRLALRRLDALEA